jgi:hypothetical protein
MRETYVFLKDNQKKIRDAMKEASGHGIGKPSEG